MDDRDREHERLVDQVGVELDQVRRSGDQLDEAVALQFGLNRTDLRCLGILYRHGRLTAGELAEESGLTPGAITTVLDRLERGGYANRVPDPEDRRRVLVVSTAATREIGARLQGEIELATRKVLEERTAGELAMIRDYLRGVRGVYEAQVAALTAEAAPGAPAREAGGLTVEVGLSLGGKKEPATSSAPLDGVTAGRLEFTKGAAQIVLRGDPGLTDLYQASFQGPVPGITVDGGTVTVQQRRRFRPFDWRTQSAEFALTAAVPWAISLRGGLWKLSADLSPLQITSLEVGGGASDIEITLPAPAGSVPVRISGGASKVVLRRPKGTEARAEVSGGASQLVFDGQRLGAVGGRTVLASSGFADAEDRYEIRFAGGASKVTVTTV
ncbi:MAG: MarR family transcriptional regulator [Actinobacteria bacterium]|nr:MarR family transcriptional regulator [Actinomycetota bacterium]